jgi:hypothetical protein
MLNGKRVYLTNNAVAFITQLYDKGRLWPVMFGTLKHLVNVRPLSFQFFPQSACACIPICFETLLFILMSKC